MPTHTHCMGIGVINECLPKHTWEGLLVPHNFFIVVRLASTKSEFAKFITYSKIPNISTLGGFEGCLILWGGYKIGLINVVVETPNSSRYSVGSTGERNRVPKCGYEDSILVDPVDEQLTQPFVKVEVKLEPHNGDFGSDKDDHEDRIYFKDVNIDGEKEEYNVGVGAAAKRGAVDIPCKDT